MLSDEPDIEIVGSAADGQEAVEFAAKLLPNVNSYGHEHAETEWC